MNAANVPGSQNLPNGKNGRPNRENISGPSRGANSQMLPDDFLAHKMRSK